MADPMDVSKGLTGSRSRNDNKTSVGKAWKPHQLLAVLSLGHRFMDSNPSDPEEGNNADDSDIQHDLHYFLKSSYDAQLSALYRWELEAEEDGEDTTESLKRMNLQLRNALRKILTILYKTTSFTPNNIEGKETEKTGLDKMYRELNSMEGELNSLASRSRSPAQDLSKAESKEEGVPKANVLRLKRGSCTLTFTQEQRDNIFNHIKIPLQLFLFTRDRPRFRSKEEAILEKSERGRGETDPRIQSAYMMLRVRFMALIECLPVDLVRGANNFIMMYLSSLPKTPQGRRKIIVSFVGLLCLGSQHGRRGLGPLRF